MTQTDNPSISPPTKSKPNKFLVSLEKLAQKIAVTLFGLLLLFIASTTLITGGAIWAWNTHCEETGDGTLHMFGRFLIGFQCTLDQQEGYKEPTQYFLLDEGEVIL